MLSNFDEIADAIWLLSQIMKFEKRIDMSKYIPDSNIEATSSTIATEKPHITPPVEKNSSEPPARSGKVASVTFTGNSKKRQTVEEFIDSPIEYAITYPKPISSLDIQRVLRPLKRKIPSRSLPVQVNVEASLYQMAKNELTNKRMERGKELSRIINPWQNVPVFQLGKEKWLDLILVIDATGESVSFFKNRIALLRRAIMESGIFRHVFEYQLVSDKDGFPKFRKINGTHEYQLKEILGPTECKIFWVVSDCISAFWDNWQVDPDGSTKSIGDVFDKVSTLYPAAIIQLMPEDLWSRTGISLHELCKVWSTAPLTPNKNLQTSVLQDAKDGFAIPVLSLSTQRLSSWVDMIAGKVTDKAVLSIFLRKSKRKRDQRPLSFLLETGEYDAVLEAFELTVPSQVRLYAAYLSVLPSVSFEELWKLSKKITPSLSEEELREVVSNIISSKLFRFKLDISEPKERIVSDLETTDRKVIRNKIPYSKQLEIMADFYDCEIVPKFLDSNGKEIDFWLFVSESIKVVNLDNDRVQEMYDVFRNVVKREAGVSIVMGEPASPQDSINNKPTPLTKPSLVDQMKINPVRSYDQTYLKLECFDISFWGEKGCGKTSMLLSMPRQGALDGYTIRRVDHYGNLIPPRHVHSEKPSVIETVEAEDYLYYLHGHSGFSGDKLFCFHDFPGNQTIDLVDTVAKVSYRHSKAIFMCLDANKILPESSNDKKTRDDLYDFLNWLDFENLQPYIAICLTKTDILPRRNEETFNNLSLWSPLERFLGEHAVSILRSRSAEIFSSSSWGTKGVWTPRRVFTPVESFMKNKG
jgi:GTPase SAR1 family protein